MVNIAIASLAFSAGLVSFVNPCGFALLPVYIAYYFKNENLEKKSLPKRIFFALLLGIIVSLGFAFTFSIIGALVSYIGKGLLKYVGWFDLFIGFLLIIIGFIYLFNLNSKINLSKLTNMGENLKSNKLNNKYISFFLYGVGFAIASLGCTLPIFLLVVTAAIKSNGLLNGIATFLIYAAGMSFFMVIFSIAIAIFKTFMEKSLKRAAVYICKLGSVIVIISGLYLIYNQITLGRLI